MQKLLCVFRLVERHKSNVRERERERYKDRETERKKERERDRHRERGWGLVDEGRHSVTLKRMNMKK